MRKFFREYNLDMFKDGISVPALSLKIMMNTAQKGFDIFKKQTAPKSRKEIIIDDKIIEEKINNYKQQDKKAKRNNENYITIVDVKNLLNRYNYRCVYCLKKLYNDFTLYRIDNEKSHIYTDCVIVCTECNVASGTQNYNKYYDEKCL